MRRDIIIACCSFLAAIYFFSAVVMHDIDPNDYR